MIHRAAEVPNRATTRVRGGFTLLEAGVVLVVLAVLMATVLPALRPCEAERLRSAADLLAADLRLARSLAVRDGTEIRLTLTATGWKIEHAGDGPPPDLPRPPLGGVGTGYEIDVRALVGRPVASTARLEGTDTAVTAVTFTPTGRTTAVRNTVFWLTGSVGEKTRSQSLVVSAPTGLVTAGEFIRGSPPGR